MLIVLTAFVAFTITTIVVVGVHECGHFFAARFFKARVEQVSVGFGRVLWQRQSGRGTFYRVRLIPLGGFVQVAEEQLKPWQRLCVILAGPLFNFVFALLIFSLVFMVGISHVEPRIKSIIPNTPAATASVPAGRIVAIDGHATPDWLRVFAALISRIGDRGNLQLQVAGAQSTHTYELPLAQLKLDSFKPDLLSALGLIPQRDANIRPLINRDQPLRAMVRAADQTLLLVQLNLVILKKLITGKISIHSLGGPLSIMDSANVSLHAGITQFFSFLALLSVCLGVMNLLPIPGLDGAQLIICGVDMWRKKALEERTQELLFRLAQIAIVVLIIQVVMNDLVRYLE